MEVESAQINIPRSGWNDLPVHDNIYGSNYDLSHIILIEDLISIRITS